MKISIQDFQSKLQLFIDSYTIDKPWREDRNAYKIWLLEVISQQTRMAQALPYYTKILEKYPRVDLLANATEDELFSLWKGLGYYSRAQNLHYTAKHILNELNGNFPSTYSELIKLKGVGEYTAAAIASFAYGENVAVLDGNVHRVLSRIYGINKTIQNSKDKAYFQSIANELILKDKSAEFNQAMMDLGSSICSPQSPRCDDCSMTEICYAYQYDKQKDLPPKKVKLELKHRYFYCLFVIHDDHIYLEKRAENDIWKGLYQGILQEGEELNLEFWKENSIQIENFDWTDWHSQLLSHQKIWVKFGVMNLESNNLDLSNFYPISNIHKIAFPRIMSKYLENDFEKNIKLIFPHFSLIP